MADLRTRYLGLELQSPLVASASPLTGSLDGLRKLEVAGAGAVVLPSLFEEELAADPGRTGADPQAGQPDQAGYGAGPAVWVPRISFVALTCYFAPVSNVRDHRQPWRR